MRASAHSSDSLVKKANLSLIYRLLKTNRFRRVLFLVDRSELGKQAADAFKETRMESLQHFADIYGIKELGEREVESDRESGIYTYTLLSRYTYIYRTSIGIISIHPQSTELPPLDSYEYQYRGQGGRGTPVEYSRGGPTGIYGPHTGTRTGQQECCTVG